MQFHNEMMSHSIIGEAAMNLALRNEEICVATLIRQLEIMHENASGELRAEQIVQARNWLRSYVNVSSRDSHKTHHGMMAELSQEKGSDAASAIRLPTQRE
ncbi:MULTISPECIES: hypothetical protein [Erwinia]|uniref:hypothetical protein n=1 Tax=Erwinia TaxID=551 RepID=UPI00068F8998|nr:MULTISPECIES: hypothetical protein [Erwinia]